LGTKISHQNFVFPRLGFLIKNFYFGEKNGFLRKSIFFVSVYFLTADVTNLKKYEIMVEKQNFCSKYTKKIHDFPSEKKP